MYTIKLSLKIKTSQNLEKLNEMFGDLLGKLWRNGQILGSDHSSAFHNNSLTCFVRCSEQESFALKYRNIHVRKAWKQLENEAETKIKIEFLGQDLVHSDAQCSEKSSFYILFTHFLMLESPIRCGDCFKPVPLYRIPHTSHDEYSDVLWWEDKYKACDTLQIGSSVGEKFGLKEISDYNSVLTREGLKICKKIEKLTKKRVFYYLFNFKKTSVGKDKQKKCPSCGGKWLLESPLHKLFDFQCKKCGLLSNLTCN